MSTQEAENETIQSLVSMIEQATAIVIEAQNLITLVDSPCSTKIDFLTRCSLFLEKVKDCQQISQSDDNMIEAEFMSETRNSEKHVRRSMEENIFDSLCTDSKTSQNLPILSEVYEQEEVSKTIQYQEIDKENGIENHKDPSLSTDSKTSQNLPILSEVYEQEEVSRTIQHQEIDKENGFENHKDPQHPTKSTPPKEMKNSGKGIKRKKCRSNKSKSGNKRSVKNITEEELPNDENAELMFREELCAIEQDTNMSKVSQNEENDSDIEKKPSTSQRTAQKSIPKAKKKKLNTKDAKQNAQQVKPSRSTRSQSCEKDFVNKFDSMCANCKKMIEVANDESSTRGIPKCHLIEDVTSWLKKESLSIEEADVVVREKYGKYKYVESSMTAQKQRMMEKIPEFKNSLAILDVLIDKKEKQESFETTFLLSDDFYTKAVVPKPDKVSIWLGANVMVEFDLENAKKLLEKNRNSVQKVIDELTSELNFVKDQITTTEVNMSHLVNYRVAQNQAKAAASS